MWSVPNVVRAFVLMIVMCGVAQAAEDPHCQAFRAQYVKPLSTLDIQAFMTDVTYRQFTEEDGNQVEYATAGGEVYLWHAGYRHIVRGQWKPVYQTFVIGNPTVTCDTPVLQLCFSYDFGKNDPLTNTWNCVPFARFQADHRDFARGDVLHLVNKSVHGELLPMELPKYAVSISALVEGSGQKKTIAK